jgi:hypothetical protein
MQASARPNVRRTAIDDGKTAPAHEMPARGIPCSEGLKKRRPAGSKKKNYTSLRVKTERCRRGGMRGTGPLAAANLCSPMLLWGTVGYIDEDLPIPRHIFCSISTAG